MTRSGISLVIAALLLQGSAARAAQLDKDSCAKLKTEQAQLEQGGTRGSMGKGPEWAKINLAPDKLEQIRRLITFWEHDAERDLVWLDGNLHVSFVLYVAVGRDNPLNVV